MAIRQELSLVIEGACLQLRREKWGHLSEEQTTRFLRHVEARSADYSGRHPIPEILSQLEFMETAGDNATVATDKGVGREQAQITSAWDERTGAFRTQISDRWGAAIEQSAKDATEDYFHKATEFFKIGDDEEATEHLCSAIVCSIATTGALLGWPHQNSDEDLRIVVGLATGSLPEEGESIYEVLQTACEQGQRLNSAFAAAMGQPQEVRSGAYEDAGRTGEQVTKFARTAVQLAGKLGRNLR